MKRPVECVTLSTVTRSFCLNTYLSCTAAKEGLEICIIVGNLHNGKECIIESGAGTCAFRTGPAVCRVETL